MMKLYGIQTSLINGDKFILFIMHHVQNVNMHCYVVEDVLL